MRRILLIAIIIAVAITVSSIAIGENWGKTERIAHFHGKINPATEKININLGNLSYGEWFETKSYSVKLPLFEKKNVTIWLGDTDWCSFGVFNHFYIEGYLANQDNQKMKNISVDLAHSNLHIYNCKPGSSLVFKIKGQAGYPKIAELEPFSLDGLHLVMHLEN